jgi:hypothetical protein
MYFDKLEVGKEPLFEGSPLEMEILEIFSRQIKSISIINYGPRVIGHYQGD